MEDSNRLKPDSSELSVQKIKIPNTEKDRKHEVRSLVDSVAQIAVDFVDQDGNKRNSVVSEMIKIKAFLKNEEDIRLNSIGYAVSSGSNENTVQDLQSVKNAEVKLNEMFKPGRKTEIKYKSGDPEGGELKQNVISIESTFNPDNTSIVPDKVVISINESGSDVFWSSIALTKQGEDTKVDYESPYTSFALPSADAEGRDVAVPAIEKANEALNAFQIAATKLHQEIIRATPKNI